MRHTDLKLLIPSFHAKVELVLADLVSEGFQSRVWETLRSRDKAAENARKGVGSTTSLHIIGAAVDVICQKHRWGCYKQMPECSFYERLGVAARKHGLFWGGDWKSRDCPHIQAVAVKDQNKLRAAATKEAFLVDYYSSSTTPISSGSSGVV